MDIIFEYENKRLILQVNPSEISVITPSNSIKPSVVGIGQIAIPQDPDLSTVKISTFLWYDRFVNIIQRYGSSAMSFATAGMRGDNTMVDDSVKFTMLNQYIKWFEDWRDSKKPARWTVVSSPTEPSYNFDFDVVCENFEKTIKAGEERDFYYNIDLIEYRHYGAEELNTKQVSATIAGTTSTVAEQAPKPRLSVKEKVTEVTLTAKDKIWDVAQRYGKGDYDKWKVLYNYATNKTLIANNLNSLAGIKLQIPLEWQ